MSNQLVSYRVLATKLARHTFSNFEHHECFVCGKHTNNSHSLMLDMNGDDPFLLALVRTSIFSNASTMYVPENYPGSEDEGTLLIAVLTCPKHHQHAQLLQGLIERDYGDARLDEAKAKRARDPDLLAYAEQSLRYAAINRHKALVAGKRGDIAEYNKHVHLAFEFVEQLGPEIAFLPVYKKIAAKVRKYSYLVNGPDPALFRHNRSRLRLFLKKFGSGLTDAQKLKMRDFIDREVTAKNMALHCSRIPLQPAGDAFHHLGRFDCDPFLMNVLAAVKNEKI